MGMKCIGIDVGGTSVKLGLFETDGTLVEKWEVKTRKEENGKYILQDVAESIRAKAAERGLIARRKEGYQEGRWIVVDFGTILVHLFHPEEREYYNLERLWVDDPQHCINYSREHAE